MAGTVRSQAATGSAERIASMTSSAAPAMRIAQHTADEAQAAPADSSVFVRTPTQAPVVT